MSDLRRVYIKSLTENLEMYFPVTPFVTVKESMATSTQDLFGFGEIDSGASAKLDTWNCESFFPDIDNDYEFDLSYTKYPSDYYVEILSRWMKQQQILVFQYYRADGYYRIVDKYCKIIGFSHGEKNGNKDVYYTLDFREYKELRLIDEYIVNSEDIVKSYGSDTYIVCEGDSLITISAKIYGDSTKWTYLMNLNGLKNPLDLKIGQGLKL
jgi:hypothetical protein